MKTATTCYAKTWEPAKRNRCQNGRLQLREPYRFRLLDFSRRTRATADAGLVYTTNSVLAFAHYVMIDFAILMLQL